MTLKKSPQKAAGPEGAPTQAVHEGMSSTRLGREEETPEGKNIREDMAAGKKSPNRRWETKCGTAEERRRQARRRGPNGREPFDFSEKQGNIYRASHVMLVEEFGEEFYNREWQAFVMFMVEDECLDPKI